MKNQSTSSLNVQKTTSPVKAIILTGFTAGVLDGTAACVHAFIARGTTPERVFQFIASKAFGAEAFSGGLPMILIGVFFHFFIAFSWTVLFFLIYNRINFLTKNKIVTGILYGVFVWLMMNMVVLPIVNGAFGQYGLHSFIGILIHICFVGMPISIMTHRYYSSR